MGETENITYIVKFSYGKNDMEQKFTDKDIATLFYSDLLLGKAQKVALLQKKIIKESLTLLNVSSDYGLKAGLKITYNG